MTRRGFQGAVLKTLGARDHELTVSRIEELAPHCRRIWMQSSTLFDELDFGPTSWVRSWFPDPDGGDTQYQRGYTIATVDEATGEFAIDIVLHEPMGPASTWAAHAQPGDSLQAMVMGTKKFTLPEDLPAGYLLIGDAASIPAINGIINAVPSEVPI